MEERRETTNIVVHVDGIFPVVQRERCGTFGGDLNEIVPVQNLGELWWYSACHFYERGVGARAVEDVSADVCPRVGCRARG